MVFGWGKKKEPVTTPQTQNILLSEVCGIASKMLKLRESQTILEIQSHRERIVPLLEEISSIGRTLETDDLKTDDIDKHIRIIVVRGKKQVIDVIKKDIVELPRVSTYDDVISLHNTLNQILKKVGDALGRQTRVIHIFAKKYATKLKDTLSDVNTGNSEIKKLLENYETSRDSFNEINDLLEQISNIKNTNTKSQQKITSLHKDIDTCKNKIASCDESIKKIQSSKQYAELKKQKELLAQLDLQKTRLDNKILDQFTKISRPLGRYEYTSSLDKEQKLLLSGLIQYPSKVLMKDNKDVILLILENVKKGITSGAISVKDTSKSLSQITDIENTLDKLISELSNHTLQQTRILKNIEQLTSTELPTLEKNLERATQDQSTIQSRILSLNAEISGNKSKTPQLIRDIEIKLGQFSNIRYIITSEN